MVLAAQILWSEDVEAALHQISTVGDQMMTPLERVLSQVETTLTVLADSVLQEQPPLRRKKLEHLVKTGLHFRTLRIRTLYRSKVKKIICRNILKFCVHYGHDQAICTF